MFLTLDHKIRCEKAWLNEPKRWLLWTSYIDLKNAFTTALLECQPVLLIPTEAWIYSETVYFLFFPYEINGGQRKIHEILESFSQQFQSTWMFILFMHTKSLFESMFKRLTLAWTQCLSLNAKNRWHTPSLEKLTWATRLTMMSTLCNSNSETWSIPWTGYPAIFLSFTFQLRDHFVFYGTADNLL